MSEGRGNFMSCLSLECAVRDIERQKCGMFVTRPVINTKDNGENNAAT